MTALRDLFDLDPKLIYLNSGTFSITPRPVLEAMSRYQREFERNPTYALLGAWERVWTVQTRLGRFFGVSPTDLFLRPNVTSVLNEFLAVRLPPDKPELLVSDQEYGAIVNICRRRVERDKRLRLRTFPLPVQGSDPALQSPAALVEHICAQLTPKTGLLLLSHILTGTGLVLPVRELSEQLRSRGILLVVDGAHGPGALPIELRDIDFYGGNLHKWFLGPKGTAFGWVHPRLQDSMEPLEAGWTSFEPAPPALLRFGIPSPRPGRAHHRPPFHRRMLHSACINFAPYFALHETFDFWEEQEPATVYQTLAERRRELEKTVQEQTGWSVLGARLPAMRGPLVAYPLPKLPPEKAFDAMDKLRKQHGLQIALVLIQGQTCLRLSPHVYNTSGEFKRAVSILKKELDEFA